ncbi:30S ribosomal protein S3ae [Candidatus Micrarchaeota archaeon]|nr:MAG: 30S ribosomal protein S3ae [Candidatus Micrarchaeota archaeon]
MAKVKAVDRWKSKQWYAVNAPEMFEGKKIADVVAAEDKLLMNRIVRVSLADMTGDMSQAYTLLDFRITDVKGKTAYTNFIGHELSRSYLRTLVRRRRNVINEVVDVSTKDQRQIRLKASIFTGTKLSTPTRTLLRNRVREEASKLAAESRYAQLVQELIFGKFASRLYNRINKLAPVRRVEIRKSELKESFA